MMYAVAVEYFLIFFFIVGHFSHNFAVRFCILLISVFTHEIIPQAIAFFKEFELVGKFFKRATKNWKM